MGEVKTNTVHAKLAEKPYATLIKAGTHMVTADEPVDLGGQDKGAKPHDLLLSALASCACITVKMYAERKGWELHEVSSRAEMVRNNDSGEQVTTTTQFMSFKGKLDETQIERLLYIASKCPVHKTLSGGMKIEIKNES